MKKFISIVLTLIMFLGMNQSVQASELTLSVAFGTPVIGETIDPKWDSIEAIEMTGVKKAGNDESSGSFKVMRDHKYLYVLAEIKDSTPYKKATAFDSDSIEIFIDQGNDKTFMDVDEDDFTVRITRDKENDIGGDRIGKYEVISDETGYTVQVSIKIDARYMIDYREIGFDIQFNDAIETGDGKDKAMGWTSNDDAYRYANERGTLVLLDSPEFVPDEIAYVKYGTPKIGQTIDPKWEQVESIPLSGERKTGNGKSSGSFKVMRDDKYLYVLIEVKDDTPFTKVATYNSDGVEIYIDQANDKTIEGTNEDDFNICITRENDLDQAIGRVKDYEVISWNEGYIVQAAIRIGSRYMIDNGKIGFDIQVNDAIEYCLEKDRAFGWTPNGESYRYANERGTLVLLDKSTMIETESYNDIDEESQNNVPTSDNSDNNLYFPLAMAIMLPFVIVFLFRKDKLLIKRIMCFMFVLTVILCVDIKDTQAALKGNDALYKGYIYTDSKYPGDKLVFRIYVPSDYKTKSYPLVLHLNGDGENGSDNEKQITYRNTMTKLLIKDENRRDYPCIIVAPQCPQGELWVTDFYNRPSKAIDMTIGLLKMICNQYNVDYSRLYVTGYSTGAEGVWDVLYRYPDMFAAAIPFAGSTAPSYANKIKNVPIWVFHSKDDESISVSESRSMVDALRKAGSKVVKFTEREGEHATAWMYAYNDANLLPWIFSQKNPNPIMPQGWQTEPGNTPVPGTQTAVPGVSVSHTESAGEIVTGTQDTISPTPARTHESKIEPFPTEEGTENETDVKTDYTWLFIILPVILLACAGVGIYFLKIRRRRDK